MSEAVSIKPPAETDWPVTNCYMDAWMPILRHWGLDPIAGLGVTVTIDYEADQFTLFKYLHEDLELLYGVVVGELTTYKSLEFQIIDQLHGGRMVLAEVDGFYLPDTRASSYKTTHPKTTIGIDSIDPANRKLSYFHNGSLHKLSGDDYAGLFYLLPGQDRADRLPPYVEFVKRRFPPLRDSELVSAAAGLLIRHLARRPESNPLRRYRLDFQRHMQLLLDGQHQYDDYAFANFRQLGANFQLLATHLDWLRRHGIDGLLAARNAASQISADTKALQFRVARMAAKGRLDPCERLFDALETSYQTVTDIAPAFERIRVE